MHSYAGLSTAEDDYQESNRYIPVRCCRYQDGSRSVRHYQGKNLSSLYGTPGKESIVFRLPLSGVFLCFSRGKLISENPT
ncbi:MAG: hypothetical protein KME25_20660 [Symplocastrum torsivum CPER-KK1]|uniref:Uncharacterized protein n=1 Tax=Symplocastrum torsivum CPER-KK1 TaxID=450513 RepID=A0A951PNE6_9CYAN|nr:hypothetical protein [Symplocastrum torsivum CPER-KK1]